MYIHIILTYTILPSVSVILFPSFSLVVPSPLSVYTDTHTLQTTSFMRIYFGFGLFKMGISMEWIAKVQLRFVQMLRNKHYATSYMFRGCWHLWKRRILQSFWFDSVVDSLLRNLDIVITGTICFILAPEGNM